MLEHDFVDVPRAPIFFADVTSECDESALLNAGLFRYFGLICISQAFKRLARRSIMLLHVDVLASDQHVHQKPTFSPKIRAFFVSTEK